MSDIHAPESLSWRRSRSSISNGQVLEVYSRAIDIIFQLALVRLRAFERTLVRLRAAHGMTSWLTKSVLRLVFAGDRMAHLV
jgi:hypothetical protein